MLVTYPPWSGFFDFSHWASASFFFSDFMFCPRIWQCCLNQEEFWDFVNPSIVVIYAVLMCKFGFYLSPSTHFFHTCTSMLKIYNRPERLRSRRNACFLLSMKAWYLKIGLRSEQRLLKGGEGEGEWVNEREREREFLRIGKGIQIGNECMTKISENVVCLKIHGNLW